MRQKCLITISMIFFYLSFSIIATQSTKDDNPILKALTNSIVMCTDMSYLIKSILLLFLQQKSITRIPGVLSICCFYTDCLLAL